MNNSMCSVSLSLSLSVLLLTNMLQPQPHHTPVNTLYKRKKRRKTQISFVKWPRDYRFGHLFSEWLLLMRSKTMLYNMSYML